MKMKKLLSVLICLIMMISLASCQGSDDKETEAPTVAPTDAPTDAPTEKPTEAPEEEMEGGFYQIFKEYDGVDFFYEEYVAKLKEKDGVSVIELPVENTPEKEYYAFISLDGVHIAFNVFATLEDSKSYYENEMSNLNLALVSKCSMLRVGTVCMRITPISVESSAVLLDVMKDVGLEGVKPVALNEKLSWDFVNTDKTPEEIKATLASLGYSAYESVSGEERVINIVSADGREYMNLTVLPVGMVDKDAFCGNLEDYEEYLNSTGLLGGNERFIFSYSETSGYAMLLASNTAADEHWAKISK